MGNCCTKVDHKKARSGLKPPAIVSRPLLAPVCAKSDGNSPDFQIKRYIDSDTISTATKYDGTAPRAESEIVDPLTGASSRTSVSSGQLFRPTKPSKIPYKLPIKTNALGLSKDVSKADRGSPLLPEQNSIKLKHRSWQSISDVDAKRKEEVVTVAACRPTSMYVPNSTKEQRSSPLDEGVVVASTVATSYQRSQSIMSELSFRSDDLMLDVDIALTPLTATDLKDSQLNRRFFADAKQSSFDQTPEEDSLPQFPKGSLRRLRPRGRSYSQKVFHQQSLSETVESPNDDVWTAVDRSGAADISSDDQRFMLQSLSGMKLSLLKLKRILNESQDQNFDSFDENTAPAMSVASCPGETVSQQLLATLKNQVHTLTLENLALKKCLSEKEELIIALRLQNDVTSTTND